MEREASAGARSGATLYLGEQRARLARLHARVASRRSDFLQKLTSKLMREHELLCIEDLNVRGLARAKLSASVLDAAFGEFRRQLTYKARWAGKHVIEVNRYYPSSRICSACGATNTSLRTTEVTWMCPCGATHDRDLNAAANLLREGIRQWNATAGARGRAKCLWSRRKTSEGSRQRRSRNSGIGR